MICPKLFFEHGFPCQRWCNETRVFGIISLTCAAQVVTSLYFANLKEINPEGTIACEGMGNMEPQIAMASFKQYLDVWGQAAGQPSLLLTVTFYLPSSYESASSFFSCICGSNFSFPSFQTLSTPLLAGQQVVIAEETNNYFSKYKCLIENLIHP